MVEMIFGKSKDELLKSTQSEVFDIMRVGANISKCRKAAGMTQTEVADRLGLSFQAVSNWERGQSCPDIANLMALAELFGVSVDRLLGSERAAKLVEEIHDESVPEMSAEEIKEIAPILKEKQADVIVLKNLADENGILTVSDIADVAPYVSEELVQESAENTLMGLGDIPDELLAYLSDDFIGEVAQKIFRDKGVTAIPVRYYDYIDSDVLGKIFEEAVKKDGFNAVPRELHDYIDEEYLGAAAMEIVKREGFDALPDDLLYNIDDDSINAMVWEAFRKGGFAAIPQRVLFECWDDEIGEMAKEAYKKGGLAAIPQISYGKKPMTTR